MHVGPDFNGQMWEIDINILIFLKKKDEYISQYVEQFPSKSGTLKTT